MKRIILPLVLIISALAGCGSFGGVDKIVIGIDDEFAPICFHDERNELVGFDIDLAKEAAERMGVEIEFKPISWANKEEEILSGSVDMIWNGLDITEERKEYMIFTRPYMDDRQILLVRKDSDLDIHAEEDLAGKIVGTQAGSTSDDYLSGNNERLNSFKAYKTYSHFFELLNALMNGEIDVLVCDELIARYEMNRTPDQLELINIRIGTAAEMAVGFRKDKIELRDKVQKTFDSMIKDGTAREISLKWFQADLIKD